MFKWNIKKVSVSSSVVLLAMLTMVACSKKDDETAAEKKAEEVKTEITEGIKVDPNKIVVSDNIMKPLAGTDPCFEAVEFVRDEGDLATYRDMGDKIILKEDYVERHGHKTYIGTIGAMLKEDRSVEEIRQVLLNKCRAFGVAYEKAKKEAAARKEIEAKKPVEAKKAE